MALWYKAWLESRVRFLTSAAVLIAYCVSFVEQARRNFPPVFEPHIPYSVFVWRGVYNGIDTLLFVAVALLLGLGGLQRERAAGTAGFTLALPATRAGLLLPRIVVAMLEMTVLSIVPAVIVPLMSARIGHFYPTSDAIRFAALFTATGGVWVAAGILWSTVTRAEYTGAAAAILTPVMYGVVVNGTALGRWPSANIFNVMNGAHLSYLDPGTSLFTGTFPWGVVIVLALVAAAFVTVSAVALAWSDF
jgi:ABC-type transport system involved in multi-copper enzyme maturation permease subunit